MFSRFTDWIDFFRPTTKTEVKFNFVSRGLLGRFNVVKRVYLKMSKAISEYILAFFAEGLF